MYGMAVRDSTAAGGRTKRSVSVLPRAVTPDAEAARPARTSEAPSRSTSCVAQGDRICGASTRLMARSNALARTGLPSLNRRPLRTVNVYVLPSRETVGGPVAASGTRRNDSGAGLSGYDIRRRHVVSSSAHAGAV